MAAAPAYDFVANLGDVVGYGASPNEVIDRSRDLGKIFVRGNHDKAATGLLELDDFNPLAAAAALWTRDQLTPEHHDWLHSLPHGPLPLEDFPDVQLVHGSPGDEDAYVVSIGDALVPLITLATPITFFGHTHLQGGFFANGSSADGFRPEYRTVGQAESVSFQLKSSTRYMINPGSVGQPRDGDWRAAFALFRYGRANRPLPSHPVQSESRARPNLRRQPARPPGHAPGRRPLSSLLSRIKFAALPCVPRVPRV